MEGPRPDKFAFVERSGTMKAPVGLLSDRTVLRQQDGGASPRQVRVCTAQRNNKSPSGAFKRPNGLAAARWRGLAPTSSSLTDHQIAAYHLRTTPKRLSALFMPAHPGRGELPDETACGRRMKRSTGQQLKMIPLCDQQPFLLQLGKLHRHGGTFHAEKICQLLTVKGDVKGEG